VDAARIAWDPGIGFGKTVEQNFSAAGASGRAAGTRLPAAGGLVAQVVAGQRRSLGRPVNDRLVPSVTAAVLAVERGARVVRVHDVRETVACAEGAGRYNFDSRATDGDNGMSRKYFGTDGIRGTVGQAPITPDFVLRLAMPWAACSSAASRRPTVLIGKDTRISGYMLESALESGFNSAGVDVVLLGPLPTPGVAYLTRAQRASLGVVISASHNAFPDNGIKFFSAQGTKLPDAWELAVEAALDEPPVWADSASLGKARRLDDAAGRYIEFCKSTFANDLTLKGLRIVVDGAHGAAYQIAPKVFHELGAEVIAIGCAPDGLNINHEVGATHPEALVRSVKAQAPTTASRWTVMPTGCRWWTPAAACTTATRCCT
jgi:hypothetical protein